MGTGEDGLAIEIAPRLRKHEETMTSY